MKRPWKVREISTGRVIRSYSTEEHAHSGYLCMFAGPEMMLARRAAELELVGPDGVYPVARIAETMRAIQAIHGIGRRLLREKALVLA